MEYTTVSRTKRLNRSIGAVWNVDSGRSEEPRIQWDLKSSKRESVLWRGYLSMHTAQTCWRGRRIQYTQRYSTESTSYAASGYQYCSNFIYFYDLLALFYLF